MMPTATLNKAELMKMSASCMKEKSEKNYGKLRKVEEKCDNPNKCEEKQGEPFYPSETSPYIYSEDKEETEEMEKIRRWAGAAAVILGSTFLFNMKSLADNIHTGISATVHHIHSTEVKVRILLTFTNRSTEAVRMKQPVLEVQHNGKQLAVSECSTHTFKIAKGKEYTSEPVFIILPVHELDNSIKKQLREKEKWKEGNTTLQAEVRCVINDKIPYQRQQDITI